MATVLVPSPDEQDYLQASLAARQARRAEEADRHAVEGGSLWQVDVFMPPLSALAASVAGDEIALERACARLEELALFGRNYYDRQALEAGLVHEVLPEDDFEPACLRRLKELASKDPIAFAITKRYLRSATVERIRANTAEVLSRMDAQGVTPRAAAEEMARYVGESPFADRCRALFERGSAWIDAHLFNGEYYEHEVRPPADVSVTATANPSITAVAIAGGFTYRAKQDYVYVIRADDENLEELKLPMSEKVQPGDIIRVAERMF